MQPNKKNKDETQAAFLLKHNTWEYFWIYVNKFYIHLYFLNSIYIIPGKQILDFEFKNQSSRQNMKEKPCHLFFSDLTHRIMSRHENIYLVIENHCQQLWNNLAEVSVKLGRVTWLNAQLNFWKTKTHPQVLYKISGDK